MEKWFLTKMTEIPPIAPLKLEFVSVNGHRETYFVDVPHIIRNSRQYVEPCINIVQVYCPSPILRNYWDHLWSRDNIVASHLACPGAIPGRVSFSGWGFSDRGITVALVYAWLQGRIYGGGRKGPNPSRRQNK